MSEATPPLAAPQPRIVPALQVPVSAGFTMIQWFYMFELDDGTKHISRATGVENKALVQAHLEQTHPGRTVELHPLKDENEITEAIKKLAEDPAWYPVNNAALKEINNAATMGLPDPVTGIIKP